MPTKLDQKMLLMLHEAALQTHLADQRDALWRGLDPAIKGSVRQSVASSAQILNDLNHLNNACDDGSTPLIVWLRNAHVLTKADLKTDIFAAAIATLTTDASPGAELLEEKALEASIRTLGEEHPDTLTHMSNMAQTLKAQGDLNGAKLLHEKALEARTRVLGEEHPSTLSSLNSLALTLKAQGDLSGAKLLQEKVVEVSRRVLGDEHPHTLISINNLAQTLKAQGDLSGAKLLNQKVVEVRTRILGPTHPKTTISQWNLLDTLIQAEDSQDISTLCQSLFWLLQASDDTLSAHQRAIRDSFAQMVGASQA